MVRPYHTFNLRNCRRPMSSKWDSEIASMGISFDLEVQEDKK